MVPRSRAYQSMGSRRKQPRPAPFAEQARCRPCGPSGRGGRPCPNDFKRLKRIRGVCSSSAGRPGSPSAGSALLLDLSARAALAGRFQWEGAFPGAASRVSRDLPRAILGRPFGAAHPLPHVGAAPRGCPPVGTGTRSRAGDGAWSMSPFLSGVFKLSVLCGQSLLDPVPGSRESRFHCLRVEQAADAAES